MKTKIISTLLFFLVFASSVFSAPADPMSVRDFAMQLAKELNSQNEIQGDSYSDITAVLPEDLKNILNSFQGTENVTRGLAGDIFSYFLDAAEVESFMMAGNETDVLTTEEISGLFEKCSREGEVLTYITPPGHAFVNRLDVKINELDQPVGDGESGYETNL